MDRLPAKRPVSPGVPETYLAKKQRREEEEKREREERRREMDGTAEVGRGAAAALPAGPEFEFEFEGPEFEMGGEEGWSWSQVSPSLSLLRGPISLVLVFLLSIRWSFYPCAS